MGISLKIIKLTNDEEINLVQNFLVKNNGLVFHDPTFNTAVSGIFNTRFYYYAAYRSNELIAVCPAHLKNNKLLKIVSLKPLYDVPYGGFVFNNDKINFKELLKLIKPHLNNKIIYASPPVINEEMQYYSGCGLVRKETALVNLEIPEDEIWANSVNSKRRNMIRKAIKAGIVVNNYTNNNGLNKIWPLLKKLHLKLGFKHLKYNYYEKVLTPYFENDTATILIAQKGNEAISGVIIIGNQYMMHYWKGASMQGVDHEGQGDLLQWEAIKWAKNKGAKYYDLCVIEPERLPHIATFKLGFSKMTVPFYIISKRSLYYKVINRIQRVVGKN